MKILNILTVAVIATGTAALPIIAAHAATNENTAHPAKMIHASASAATPTFAKLDKDHSGKISLHEYIASTHMKESKSAAEQQFASLDKNKDRQLTASEFSGAAESAAAPATSPAPATQSTNQ